MSPVSGMVYVCLLLMVDQRPDIVLAEPAGVSSGVNVNLNWSNVTEPEKVENEGKVTVDLEDFVCQLNLCRVAFQCVRRPRALNTKEAVWTLTIFLGSGAHF